MKKFSNTEKLFKEFLTSHNETMQCEDLKFDEFEEAFRSLTQNKSAGFDDASSNIIIDAYDCLKISYSMFLRSQFNKEYFLIA